MYLYEGKVIIYYIFESRVKSTLLPSDADLTSINTLFIRRLFVRSGFASVYLALVYLSSR